MASQTLILCYTEAKCSVNAVQQVAVKMVAHSIAAQDKLENDHVRAIATLSEKLKVPEHEVVDIFRKEFDRLATHARISTFLIVLAMRNTRSILRGRGGGETCFEGVLSKNRVEADQAASR
jgi:hypothetical protein